MGSISDSLILVTLDVMGLCPNIHCQAELKALKTSLEAPEKKIPTKDLVEQ